MVLPGACGGIVTTGDSPGFLFSPGWPGSYPPNLDCSWLIRSDASTVELNLLSVDIEDFPVCYLDSLVIRDGELWKRIDVKLQPTVGSPPFCCSAHVLFCC